MKMTSRLRNINRLHAAIVGLSCVFLLGCVMLMVLKIEMVEEHMPNHSTSHQAVDSGRLIINPHSFVYLNNPGDELCDAASGNNIELFIMIPSRLANFEQRIAIRNTWANKLIFPQMKLVFLLGTSDNANVSRRVRNEVNLFNDIVQEDFVDSYKNLTLKTLMGMKWVSQHCKNARFVLKVDDDVIVNTKLLYEYLEFVQSKQRVITNTFFCKVWQNMRPFRNQSSKWYVSNEEYPHEFYPTFCDGHSYVFSADLAASVFNMSHYHKTLYLEDVSIGMLAKQLNARFIETNEKHMIYKAQLGRLIKMDYLRMYIFICYANIIDLYTVWNNIFFHDKH